MVVSGGYQQSIASHTRVKRARKSPPQRALVHALLHNVIVHNKALANVGLDGIDDLKAVALVCANAQHVTLVDGKVHGAQAALAAQILVKRDHAAGEVAAAFAGAQVDLGR